MQTHTHTHLRDDCILYLGLHILHASQGSAAQQVFPQVLSRLKLRVVLGHKLVIELRHTGQESAVEEQQESAAGAAAAAEAAGQ